MKEFPSITVARCMGFSVPKDHIISYGQLYKKGVRHEVKTHNVPVYVGRNEAVQTYFKAIPLDDYLIFLDTDMIFPPDTLLRLTSHGLPVVGGLYYMKDPPFEPVLFRYKSRILVPDRLYGETGQYNIIANWDDGALIKVDGLGAGCMAIRRDVLEKIPYPWFTFQEGTEDLWFCRKAHQAGFEIHVDTSIECGHLKMLPIAGAHYRAYREARNKGLKPQMMPTVFIAVREWIADEGIDAPPLEQMGVVERKWTEDTTR